MYCLTIVSLCVPTYSRYSVSIVPLYKSEKKSHAAATQRTHPRISPPPRQERPRAISRSFCQVYESKNARSNSPRDFPREKNGDEKKETRGIKKKEKKNKSEVADNNAHTHSLSSSPRDPRCSNSRLNIFLRFYGLRISAEQAELRRYLTGLRDRSTDQQIIILLRR